MKAVFLALLLITACSVNPPVSQDTKQPEKRNTAFIETQMNDPLLPNQKYIYETGINKAWKTTTGNPSLKIAVIDGEVKAHSDLAVPSIRFYSLDAPLDHATPIASIIGAAQNNGIGMAGITKCQILSYVAQTKMDTYLGDFRLDMVERAFYQAVADGAKIINCSFGTKNDLPPIRAAVSYAIQRGVVVVAAAGNSGETSLTYPAAYPSVIGVGASYEGKRTEWSSHGSWVAVYAPGQGLLTLLPDRTTILSGTSAATPVVTGTVGLMLSVNPKLKPLEIRQIILLTSKAGQLDAYEAMRKVK